MTEIPDFLSHLPIERGLPIPFVNQHPDDEWEYLQGEGVESRFKMLSTIQTIVAGQNNLCGICGRTHDYWKWFFGGDKAHENRSHTDSPMHWRCLEFAMTTCPYIVFPKRDRDEDLDKPEWTPSGFMADKPDLWVAGRTRGYELLFVRGEPVYRARPWAESKYYRYSDGKLVEVSHG